MSSHNSSSGTGHPSDPTRVTKVNFTQGPPRDLKNYYGLGRPIKTWEELFSSFQRAADIPNQGSDTPSPKH